MMHKWSKTNLLKQPKMNRTLSFFKKKGKIYGYI